MATQILSGSPSEIVAGGKFQVSDNNPVTVVVVGLAGSEKVDVQISYNDGANWVDIQQSGSPMQFGLTNNVITLDAPGTYRLNKDTTTAGAVTGYMATSFNP